MIPGTLYVIGTTAPNEDGGGSIYRVRFVETVTGDSDITGKTFPIGWWVFNYQPDDRRFALNPALVEYIGDVPAVEGEPA